MNILLAIGFFVYIWTSPWGYDRDTVMFTDDYGFTKILYVDIKSSNTECYARFEYPPELNNGLEFVTMVYTIPSGHRLPENEWYPAVNCWLPVSPGVLFPEATVYSNPENYSKYEWAQVWLPLVVR